ncbi:MAG: bifunctional alpha/beta hydrolase/OsmC family protein [Proteobacteria bacterium]|nr:bifunctional alpha/beta hydrolase/OsmC family protein [Pseudomonadota bacterium]
MARIKATFPNRQNHYLAGLLETPDTEIKSYALFAHCFTCSKDVAAASRITRALTDKGIATLRFDFTGLGNSDGDFSNTNFSSNVDDLVYAAKYLEQHHASPRLIIGHSLGGAAVLIAAQKIESISAVVTIAAPATAEHVGHLLETDREKIIANEESVVNLAGRKFKFKRQFLEDIDSYNTTEHIRKLGKPLLIFHSPNDDLVSIDEAAKIYTAAKHPKSFISLDKADHLLTQREDSEYVAGVLASWAERYLNLDEVKSEMSSGTTPKLGKGEILVTEKNKKFTRAIFSANHQLISDEPAKSGGDNLGPDPYELLLASLGSCTSMTIRMYANRKKYELDNVEVKLIYDRQHCEDCKAESYIEKIQKFIKLEGNLNKEQKNKLLEIADRCPVHRTMSNDIIIESSLSE